MAEVKWQARRVSDSVLVDVTADVEGLPVIAPTPNAIVGGAGGGGLDVTDGTTTVTGATEISLIGPTVSDEGGGVAGVALPLLQKTVVLTDAQIKALPTTPVPLVPAPGATQMLAPLAAWLFLNWVADYSNLDANGRIGIGYAGTLVATLGQFAETELGNLLQDGASHAAFAGLRLIQTAADSNTLAVGQFQDEPGVLGAGLEIYGANGAAGNFTGGNAGNTLSVTVWYGVVETA